MIRVGFVKRWLTTNWLLVWKIYFVELINPYGAIIKPSNDVKLPTHSFDISAKSTEVHVCLAFNLGDPRLIDLEFSRELLLGKFASASEFCECHVLDDLIGASANFSSCRR